MYHVRSRNRHLPSVIRNSELIVKILGKSDNNPDHLDIGVGRDIGDEGKRDVARIFSGMVQKRVTAQGWLGSTPVGQRPQIRGLRAGGSLAVASSIPATQLSSPARLAERVVTPHAPRPNDVGWPTTFPGRQNGGDPAASGDLRLGHRAPGRGGRRASIPLHALTTLLSALGAFCLFEPRVARICPGNLRCICSDNGNASQGADNTSVRAGGVLSVGIPRFLNKSQHFTVHLFRPWRPGSARGSDGGPRRFTVCGNSAFSQQISTFYGPSVQAMETRLGARQRRRPPTVHRGRTHAPRLQRPVKTKRARARS